MSNELVESKGVSNPLVLIQAAIEKGMDPNQLGKLMDLQERWERNRAAEAFADAVTGFQRDCPQIFKGRQASGKGTLQFAYASLDDVMRVAGPIMARHRIAATYTTEPSELLLKVTCRVRVGIHSEESTVTLPIPAGTVGNTQLFGQAVSYGKRYALCAALGIVVTDEDNDAASLDTLRDEEQSEIMRLIEEKHVNLPRFLEWAQVADIKDIRRGDFAKVLDTLKRKNGGPK